MAPRKYNKKNEVSINIETSRPMPEAKEVEAAVLGAIMIDKDAFALVNDDLSEESFFDSRHKLVYRAIRTLGVRSLPIDVLTVTEELNKQGLLNEIGGPPFIAELSSRVASSANLEYHAKILAQKERERKIITICAATWDRIFAENEDIDVIHEDIEKRLYDLARKGITNSTVDLISSVGTSIKMIQAAQAKPDGITGVPSGYQDLDNITAGFQSTDLIILAGRPAMGKTAFAICLAWHMVSQDIPVAFFSLEMSHPQLTNRLISSICEIEGGKLLRGTLDRSEWDRIDKAVPLMDKPLYIDDTPGQTIFQLSSKARYLVKTKDVKIIFVDYMQLLNVTGEDYSTKQEKVSIISGSLKALAKELNIPIIALSQLNRGIENREGLEGKRPQLSDLRESGAIEQDADLVMFVHRPEYYHINQTDNGKDLRGLAQIIIAKHRKGATGDVNLVFKAEYTRFEDPKLLPLPDISSLPPVDNSRICF